jgi:decaprenyl-phosphate phosphoribosyltransferase
VSTQQQYGEQGVAAIPVPTWRGHLEIARLDHWVKNVFVLPGAAAALAFDPAASLRDSLGPLILALLAIGLVASSNYTLNELLDGRFDAHHPKKRHRAVPSGRVHPGLALVQWIVLFVGGAMLGLLIGQAFFLCLVSLWIMGCVYNIPPIRTKDVPYVDVVTEAVNNPIRMLAGWYAVSAVLLPPVSLLVAYWMAGCYFMAIKRFAEVRTIGDRGTVASYRRSLAAITEEGMLISVMFYGSVAMLFFGAFLMRYRMEMILTFPLIALVMAIYLKVSFQENSPVQHPEKLYRERALMLAVGGCALAMGLFLFIDIPLLHDVFAPTVPTAVPVP